MTNKIPTASGTVFSLNGDIFQVEPDEISCIAMGSASRYLISQLEITATIAPVILLQEVPIDDKGVAATPEFFYTTNRPHIWSAGKTDITANKDSNWDRFTSLEQVKAFAEDKRIRSGNESAVDTTYGVRYEFKVD